MEAKSLKEVCRIYRQIQGKLADLALASREVYEDCDPADGSSQYSELHKDICRDIRMVAFALEKVLAQKEADIQEFEYDLRIEDRDCWVDSDWDADDVG